MTRFRSKPTVVDLFSGAGLLSHAFQSAGYEIVRAVELDRVAASTYFNNVGEHIERADVRTVRPNGRCDVLIGGPPCQGFSTLGKRATNDPRNLLSYEMVRWARVMKPRAVVIENVAAYLESDVAEAIRKQFRRLGYAVTTWVLNAFDYGVPQLRQRSFTIATLSGKMPSLPRPYRSCQTVKEAWEGLPRFPNGKRQHIAPAPSPLALARMKLIPPGGDKRDVMRRAPRLVPPSWWKVKAEVTDAWGRMRWDEPSNTLRTCLLNPSKGRYIHPTEHRVMSIREAARLHTIPDEWKFVGTPGQIARQIGNSVPPKLGNVIARSIYTYL